MIRLLKIALLWLLSAVAIIFLAVGIIVTITEDKTGIVVIVFAVILLIPIVLLINSIKKYTDCWGRHSKK